jgi:hypothetical protein
LWIHAAKSKAVGIKFTFNYVEHSQNRKKKKKKKKKRGREMRLQRYLSGDKRKDIIRNKSTHEEEEVSQLRTR